MYIVWVHAHFAWCTGAVLARWPIDWIYVGLVWCAEIAGQGNTAAVEDVMPPKDLLSISSDMGIVF
jgi:hypothetical protein